MNCPVNRADLAMRRASGALTPEEQNEFERHLTECAPCRSLAEAQQAVWDALDEWPAAPVSDDFDQRLYARIAAEEAAPWWKRLGITLPHGAFAWGPALAVAFGCVAILAVFLLQGPVIERHLAPGPTAQQKTIDIDQVESALDDVDMLNQLGGAVPVSKTAAQSSAGS